MTNLPATRLSQHAVETAYRERERIWPFARVQSAVILTACRQAGLPMDLAELCSGLLASLADDLIAVSKLPRTDFERSKRLERILSVCEEPSASALRCAMAASPTNGRACARHWDAVCDKAERGKLAWLLGLDTDSAYVYSRKREKNNRSG